MLKVFDRLIDLLYWRWSCQRVLAAHLLYSKCAILSGESFISPFFLCLFFVRLLGFAHVRSSVKKNRALSGTPSQTYSISIARCDHTLLPATQHKWTHPALAPAKNRYSTYLPRRDRRLSWPRQLVTYWGGLPTHRWSPIQVLTHLMMVMTVLIVLNGSWKQFSLAATSLTSVLEVIFYD